ncbi:hypothetical protein D3C87_1095440 [compost metagenome]
MATGKNTFSNSAIGTIISLLINDPLVIAQSTGSSLEDRKPVDFSALTARSSPSIPAVFLAASLALTATSSIKAPISSKIAKKPEAISLSNWACKIPNQSYSERKNIKRFLDIRSKFTKEKNGQKPLEK